MVARYGLTLCNSSNIGRLLPQSFFYTFAFTRIKKQVSGGIYYAQHVGNYGNLVAGLYGWQTAMPVNGFIVPCTNNLTLDLQGNVTIVDGRVPMNERSVCDPADPSNLERMEYMFKTQSLMLRSFVYPAEVTDEECNEACKELYMKYKIFADKETSKAYAAMKARKDDVVGEDSAVVLVARNSPSLSESFLMHNLGEVPPKSKEVEEAFEPVKLNRPVIAPSDIDYLTSVLNSLNLLRLF